MMRNCQHAKERHIIDDRRLRTVIKNAYLHATNVFVTHTIFVRNSVTTFALSNFISFSFLSNYYIKLLYHIYYIKLLFNICYIILTLLYINIILTLI